MAGSYSRRRSRCRLRGPRHCTHIYNLRDARRSHVVCTMGARTAHCASFRSFFISRLIPAHHFSICSEISWRLITPSARLLYARTTCVLHVADVSIWTEKFAACRFYGASPISSSDRPSRSRGRLARPIDSELSQCEITAQCCSHATVSVI